MRSRLASEQACSTDGTLRWRLYPSMLFQVLGITAGSGTAASQTRYRSSTGRREKCGNEDGRFCCFILAEGFECLAVVLRSCSSWNTCKMSGMKSSPSVPLSNSWSLPVLEISRSNGPVIFDMVETSRVCVQSRGTKCMSMPVAVGGWKMAGQPSPLNQSRK